MARRKKQNEEESQENINNESDDTFGLPEIEYEPLKRDEPVAQEEPAAESVTEPQEEVAPEQENSYQEEIVDDQEYKSPYAEEDEEPSVWPKVLGFGVVILIGAAAVWYFLVYQPKQKEAKEKARQEQVAREEAARKQEEDRLAELKRQDEQRRADSLANAIPAEGTIEALTERTGLYYIVVASAIDDDLIMDYAKKLSLKGVSCKIVPPFGKTKFSRLAIDSKDTYADAQSTADGMKGGDFGNDIWVVKY